VSEQEIEDESMPKPMVPQSMLTSSMVSILEVPPIEIAKQLTILEHGSSRSSLLFFFFLLLLLWKKGRSGSGWFSTRSRGIWSWRR